MKQSKILLIIAFLISFSACEKDDSKPKNSVPEVSENCKIILKKSNFFGFELFKKSCLAYSAEKNTLISPLSISSALSMTMNGANGKTLEGMKKCLAYEGLNLETINSECKIIREQLLNSDSDVSISIANSIWYRQGFSVLPEFIENNKNFYNSEVRELDFTQAEQAKETINNWVKEKTNNLIPSIVNTINRDDVMFLINAIYFKGNWKYSFDENLTENKDFYTSGNYPVSVSTMTTQANLNFARTSDFEAVELPYGNGNYSMVLIKPLVQTLDIFIANFDENTWVNCTNFTQKEVQVQLPKFKVEYKDLLNGHLKSLGMEEAFNQQKADFTKINSDGNLYISRVNHKTFIEVNEKGTEAAAVTAVGILETSAGEMENFTADKPFMYVIKENSTGSILFIGKMVNPTIIEN